MDMFWDPLRTGTHERTGPSAWNALLESVQKAISNEPSTYMKLKRMQDLHDILIGLEETTTTLKTTISPKARKTNASSPKTPPKMQARRAGNFSSAITHSLSAAGLPPPLPPATRNPSILVWEASDSTIAQDTVASPVNAVRSTTLNGDEAPWETATVSKMRPPPVLLAFECQLRTWLRDGDRPFVATDKDFLNVRSEAFQALVSRGFMTTLEQEKKLNKVMEIWATKLLSRERAQRISGLVGTNAPEYTVGPPLTEGQQKTRALCESESEYLGKIYETFIAAGHKQNHPIRTGYLLSSLYKAYWNLAEEIVCPGSKISKVIDKYGLEPTNSQGPNGAAFAWLVFRLHGVRPDRRISEEVEAHFFSLIQVSRFIHVAHRHIGKGALALFDPPIITRYLPLDSRAFGPVIDAIKAGMPQVSQLCKILSERLVRPVLRGEPVEAGETPDIATTTFFEYVDALLPSRKSQKAPASDPLSEETVVEPFKLKVDEFPPLG